MIRLRKGMPSMNGMYSDLVAWTFRGARRCTERRPLEGSRRPSIDLDEARNLIMLILAATIIGVAGETIAYLRFGAFLMWCVAATCIMLTLTGNRDLAYPGFLLVLLNMPEYSRYITTVGIYTLRTVSLGGISLSAILIGFYVIYEIVKRLRLRQLRVEQSFILLSVGLVYPGVIGILRVLAGEQSLGAYQEDLTYWVLILGAAFASLKLNPQRLQSVIAASLIARPIVIMLAWLFGLGKGDYGGAPIATYDPINELSTTVPLLLMLSGSTTCRPFLAVVLLSSLCVGGVLLLQPSGKGLLLAAVVMLLGLFVSVRRQRLFGLVAFGLSGVILAAAALGTVNSIPETALFKSKFQQVISLGAMLSADGSLEEKLQAVARSPRMRFLELVNIYADLSQSAPWQLWLGRGLGGHFTDVWISMRDLTPDDFSIDQIETRRFYKVHQSINYVLLKYGIIGIGLWSVLLCLIMKWLRSSTKPVEGLVAVVLLIIVGLYLGYSLKLAILLGTIVGSLRTQVHSR